MVWKPIKKIKVWLNYRRTKKAIQKQIGRHAYIEGPPKMIYENGFYREEPTYYEKKGE